MDIPKQKTIEECLLEKNVPQDKKEKVILAITDILYQRNQNVVKFEKEKDDSKKKQYLRSIKEYDDIIESKFKKVINGRRIEHTYDF